MKIDDLIVTHNQLRDSSGIPSMVEYIRGGGIWNRQRLEEYSKKHHPGRCSPLIQISRFEDGLLYLHDGHHRVVSIKIAGRPILLEEEYQIKDWRYEQYLEINFAAGWVTPFDPRTHCRRENTAAYKEMCRLVEASQDYLREIGQVVLGSQHWVRSNWFEYREPRFIRTVAELAQML
jgi:hypothetical protein